MAGRTRHPAVYIMANQPNGTLYVGVTSDLVARTSQHRTPGGPGFTARYNCTILVWFELHADMREAITREKELKAGPRKKKLALIEATNPQWRDLYPEIL